MSKRKSIPQPEKVELPIPPGKWADGELQCFTCDSTTDFHHLKRFGIKRGDIPVFIKTADVASYDLAWLEEEEGVHIGQYFTAPGDRFTFHGADGVEVIPKKGKRAIQGRVIGIVRAGKYVEIGVPIRPLKKAAPPPAVEREETTARDVNLTRLRAQLESLDREPSNEACRFQLETEIYKLEREQDGDEWGEFIDA